MYEFHFAYAITPKDEIKLKMVTWRRFQPFGIQYGNPDLMNGRANYPGKLREWGLGFGYQRFWGKGLFTTVEVLPLLKIYLDSDKNKIGNGFRLYTSYHYFEPIKNHNVVICDINIHLTYCN